MGTITDDLMRNPDMWDSSGEPCLLVVKSGNATGTTIGRANGIFSIVRDYFNDMSINQTSMEWGIIHYDSKSEVFSEPGDSGSAIADIRGPTIRYYSGYTDASKSIDNVRSFIRVERFNNACKGGCPSSSNFSRSKSKFWFSSSIVPSPSNTCGKGECCLDFTESVLERKDSPPLVLGLDSGMGEVGVTPDAAPLTENREENVGALLVMENLEYR